jgi:2-methylcitrate dehydratase PrpD
MGVTQEVAHYVAKTRYRDIRRRLFVRRVVCLDGLGVALAGVTEEGSRIVLNHVRQLGGKEESTVLGTRLKVPAPKAALINGVSGHAMDYDDTQLSTSKEAVYGLLTHPTTPVLNAL